MAALLELTLAVTMFRNLSFCEHVFAVVGS
jgi:hypothetical protein